MNIAAFRHDFFLILPEVELALFGLAILLFDFMLGVKDKTGQRRRSPCSAWSSAAISLYRLRALGPDAIGGFDGSIIVDPFFLFFGMIFLVATALVILLSVRYLQIEDEHHGEYYALLLFATVGHDVHGLRLRPDRAVPRPRDHGHQLLHPDGLPAASAAIERSRREVSAAGRVQLRPAGLRLFAAVRHQRHGRPERPGRPAAASAAHESGRGAHGAGLCAARPTCW